MTTYHFPLALLISIAEVIKFINPLVFQSLQISFLEFELLLLFSCLVLLFPNFYVLIMYLVLQTNSQVIKTVEPFIQFTLIYCLFLS